MRRDQKRPSIQINSEAEQSELKRWTTYGKADNDYYLSGPKL